MKNLFLTISLFLCTFLANAQSTAELWLTSGVKYDLSDNTDIGLDLNERFGAYRFQSFFPEVFIKHKVNKYFKPSLEYRAVWDLKKNGQYGYGNRINLNLNFEYDLNKKTEVSFRVRYQQGFNRIANQNYSADFDNALRLKPEIKYEIKKIKTTPNLGLEFFYNPSNSELGNRFNRIRYYVGLDFNIKGPNELGIKYFYDQNFNLPNTINRHGYSIAYTYVIKRKTNDEIIEENDKELKKD